MAVATLQTAALGGRRAMLVALRNAIAEQIDLGVPARDLAALSRRLMEIAVEIDEVDAANPDGEDDVTVASETKAEAW